MSVIIGLLFFAIVFAVLIWRQRKAGPALEEKFPLSIKLKPPPAWEGIFIHPGHAWLKVIQPDLVAVGTDEFTKSVFGTVETLTLPEPGTQVHQGEKTWRLKRGARELSQTSPISGTVIEINKELVNNPKLLAQDAAKNWVLKIKPSRLKTELQNLLHGSILKLWNQAVKDQLVSTLTLAEYPVLQEGGEIKPDLGDELTYEQWLKVNQEFFESDE